ncbi:MAG: uracil-DNA glycosylase [Parachlamydiales bacterium]|nr:uracil-DNA glycosylase [Parachlamydiales bacterium]
MTKSQQMSDLKTEIVLCKKCPLFQSRKNAIPGIGSYHSKIFMIGEAPGKQEDEEKKPFIGRSGTILAQWLSSIHLLRKDIYITNIVKCHPPNNRDPSSLEISTCFAYLIRQLTIIQPSLILTLGRHAAKALFSLCSLPFTSLQNHHGKLYSITLSYGTVRLIPLFHPATLCYRPSMKKILYSDMQKVAKHIH